MDASRDNGTLKIGAILNTSSGACDENSEEQMQTIFEELNLTPLRIWCGGSKELQQGFDEMDALDLDILVVLGGDGTIRSAASRTTFRGPCLIPLPGGTMNVLPKALYGNRSWQEILKDTLTMLQIKTISCGEISGERFFITAIIGAPALWANAREALREGDVGLAVQHGRHALDSMFASKVEYVFNESNHGSAEAITVTCPLITPTLDDTWQGFEAAVIDVNDAAGALGLATSAAFGAWREDQNITIVRTSQVNVTSEKDIPIILDGETVEVGSTIEVVFVPEAFRAIVPSL
jgi:diacylglycerol kinase family enzyme